MPELRLERHRAYGTIYLNVCDRPGGVKIFHHNDENFEFYLWESLAYVYQKPIHIPPSPLNDSG
jgi:hypothetical protein